MAGRPRLLRVSWGQARNDNSVATLAGADLDPARRSRNPWWGLLLRVPDTTVGLLMACGAAFYDSPRGGTLVLGLGVFRRNMVLWPIILWVIGAAGTFVLNVVATWQGDSFGPVKLLTNVTLDPLLAAWWPITWAVWGLQNLLGYPTPLDLVFG